MARTRWFRLTWTSISSQLAAFLVFALSMRFAGIPASQVSLVAVFAAFTFGMLAASIPITPAGLGTADAVYIAVMVTVGVSSSAAVAGDLVFRAHVPAADPRRRHHLCDLRRKKSWLKPRGTGPQSSV